MTKDKNPMTGEGSPRGARVMSGSPPGPMPDWPSTGSAVFPFAHG